LVAIAAWISLSLTGVVSGIIGFRRRRSDLRMKGLPFSTVLSRYAAHTSCHNPISSGNIDLLRKVNRVDLPDSGCLGLVEPSGINGLGDGLLGEADPLFRPTGQIEQPNACGSGDLIFGPETDPARDKNPIGILVVGFGDFRD
jgi:hypothetical protein